MTAAPIHLGPDRFMLDPAGLLWWPARRLLAVADLHLEKGSAFAAAGRLVPPYDTRETLQRLGNALRRYRPQRLVALGDSFHDAGGAARMAAGDADVLRHLIAGLDMVWVLGNHDPTPPAGLPGLAVTDWIEDGVVFRHQAQPGRATHAEISGHFHPKATMPTRAGGITRPCFVTDARRAMLPSFGAYTGGLDVQDVAIASLFPRGGRAFLLGRERLFSLPLGPVRRVAAPA